MAGDFNTTTWGVLFHEWTQEGGVVDLLEPIIPAFAVGTSSDKFLFVPGFYVPSTFLPPSEGALTEKEFYDAEPYFPAAVLDKTYLAGHFPILLQLPCDAEEDRPTPHSRLRVNNLTPEQWEERNLTLEQLLDQLRRRTALSLPVVNIHRWHSIIDRAINDVFRRERVTAKSPAASDPFEHFMFANISHPDMENLPLALETRNTAHSGRYMRRISADGWKSYLWTVNENDARAFFAYLARAEGWGKWGFAPADTSPMLHEDGGLMITEAEKLRLITQAFRRRGTAPAVLNPGKIYGDPNGIPLPPFRRQIRTANRPITLPEVQLAMSNLTSGGAPGPDGIPTEVLKNLAPLRPYLLALFIAMYRTGYIPAAMRQL